MKSKKTLKWRILLTKSLYLVVLINNFIMRIYPFKFLLTELSSQKWPWQKKKKIRPDFYEPIQVPANHPAFDNHYYISALDIPYVLEGSFIGERGHDGNVIGRRDADHSYAIYNRDTRKKVGMNLDTKIPRDLTPNEQTYIHDKQKMPEYK